MLNMLYDKRFQGTEAWKKFYQYSANKDNEDFSEKLKLIVTKQVIGIDHFRYIKIKLGSEA